MFLSSNAPRSRTTPLHLCGSRTGVSRLLCTNGMLQFCPKIELMHTYPASLKNFNRPISRRTLFSCRGFRSPFWYPLSTTVRDVRRHTALQTVLCLHFNVRSSHQRRPMQDAGL